MNDREFLDYCYWHSKTERHLFHVDHAKRLLRLAGESEDYPGLPQGREAFVGMDFDFVKPRVEHARVWLDWLEKNPRLREVFKPLQTPSASRPQEEPGTRATPRPR